ncbi:hypothetical protein V1264_017697 [Littorina saxatilis]|uniref:Reverse transcriptase n=1 Tax=Littorina saxatilis TaxID=31220 RepID=A0AAN9GFP2_9CAEN
MREWREHRDITNQQYGKEKEKRKLSEGPPVRSQEVDQGVMKYLEAHMNRKFKLAPSPTCACGQEDQTAEHILQRCPLLDEERKEVWPSPTPLQTKLYGSRQELEKTTTFITSAGLIV